MYDKYYQDLANAIIIQAARDLRLSCRRLKKHPNDYQAQDTVREITRFFCSQDFSALSGVDGPALLRQIIEEINDGTTGST